MDRSRRGNPKPGQAGPGHRGPRMAPCGDSCPASRARPIRISPSPSLPLRSRGRASTPRTEKRILPGAEGLLSVRDGEERLLSGQRFHQRKGLAAQQRRHRGGAGRDGAPKARPLRCAALGPGSPGRTSERSAWLPGRWGRGGVRGRRELRLPSELAGPRHGHESKGNASRGKNAEILLAPSGGFHLTPISAEAAASHDSSPAGTGGNY